MGCGGVPARTVPGGPDGPGAGGLGQSTAASAGGATARARNPVAGEARHPMHAPAMRAGRPSDGPAGLPPRSPRSPADCDPGGLGCAGGGQGSYLWASSAASRRRASSWTGSGCCSCRDRRCPKGGERARDCRRTKS